MQFERRLFSAKDGAAALKLWEKPWWNGSQNVNLSDFECSQKVVRWGIGMGLFCVFCSLLILKFKSVLEKCPTEHHWERLRKILFSFFMPFQIIFKEYFFADFLKGMNDGGENFHCFFSKSNFGRDCIKYAQLQTT